MYTHKRLPSYCDRILWRSTSGQPGTVGPPQPAPDVTTSDHKPVATLLLLRARPPRPAWWPRPDSTAAVAAANLAVAGGHAAVPMTWKLEFVQIEVKFSVVELAYEQKQDKITGRSKLQRNEAKPFKLESAVYVLTSMLPKSSLPDVQRL